MPLFSATIFKSLCILFITRVTATITNTGYQHINIPSNNDDPYSVEPGDVIGLFFMNAKIKIRSLMPDEIQDKVL